MTLCASVTCCHSVAIAQATPVGSDLQAVLDAGEDLLLEAGQVYELQAPLVFIQEGQRIATYQPKSLSDYATLRIANPEQGQLIQGNHVDGVVIEQVVLDGNRLVKHVRVGCTYFLSENCNIKPTSEQIEARGNHKLLMFFKSYI